ncbi:pyridoxal 5'-phosphate synthase glutaminase subunit PdxT [Inquilinus limosus]|uniref:Pyridoxal 5'-phosphate synthase subunit PdxT n=1 Tax=Inquilinus limosus TaxID=171674 RepID=A0A211ZJX1_9PROT|nr:pyridoxal 5'-phosphate synthase glutaminase subunit PdxT [Inquilinus limosus]OWJ65486.1 pyridoxal 5'-phosphate synthase glutaminase subunit PdxT [Inquilinus limosus]
MVTGRGRGTPRIGVLALQGDFEAHARALGEAGAEAVPVRLPAHLEGLAGLVIPGGESSALLKLAARDGMYEALSAFVWTMPVFGTCAGCILLARRVLRPEQRSLGVLDATVERNAYGRQIDSAILETPTALPGGPLEAVYIRAPRIAVIGPGVEVLAERDGDPVLVRQGRLLAATFHPELSADRRVHRLFIDIAAGAGRGAERAA